MEETLEIAAWATGGKFGSGVYEIHKDGRYAGLVSVSHLKDKGLVRRIDHTKKVEAFLNTEEGRKWFKESLFHSRGI